MTASGLHGPSEAHGAVHYSVRHMFTRLISSDHVDAHMCKAFSRTRDSRIEEVWWRWMFGMTWWGCPCPLRHVPKVFITVPVYPTHDRLHCCVDNVYLVDL